MACKNAVQGHKRKSFYVNKRRELGCHETIAHPLNQEEPPPIDDRRYLREAVESSLNVDWIGQWRIATPIALSTF